MTLFDVQSQPIDERTATISACGQYRYDLTRRWADGPLVLWV